MDDEEQVRVLAIKMLTHLGFEAEGVAEGAEAVRAYTAARQAGRPFDVVIMDLTISGGMGGKETIGILVAADPAARVIVSSGYSNDPIMASYKDFGFTSVLAKPYRLSQLKDTLAVVLQG
jgi:two-component system cell cycle sensor histidine kinase/response regulator CckA